MSVNKVILLGNLCQNPAVKNFDNGGKIVNFSLATNERAYKTKDGKQIEEKSEFHNLVINAKGLADVAEKYLHKGDKVYIEGKLRTRTYEDANKVKHYTTEIVVSSLEMLTSKPKEQATQEAEKPKEVIPVFPDDKNELPF